MAELRSSGKDKMQGERALFRQAGASILAHPRPEELRKGFWLVDNRGRDTAHCQT